MLSFTDTVNDLGFDLGNFSILGESLVELPTEIIQTITSFMDLATIRTFLLSCRADCYYGDYHFKRSFRHALHTDFSTKDYGFLAGILATNPQALSHVDILSVAPTKEFVPMGVGFNWARRNTQMDFKHAAIKSWLCGASAEL